jgi:hypothetical protein
MNTRTPILQPDGTYLIPLTRGFFARIDADDLEKVSRYTWQASTRRYATTTIGWGEYAEKLAMHRLVTDCPEGMVPDHINFDTLDNRKANLRICTPSENSKRKQKKTPEQRAAEVANKELRIGIGLKAARRALLKVSQPNENLAFEIALEIADALEGYVPILAKAHAETSPQFTQGNE